jgi:hypothetical protein
MLVLIYSGTEYRNNVSCQKTSAFVLRVLGRFV